MSTNALVMREGQWQAVISHLSGVTQLEPWPALELSW
jgi:hypothetical protein